MKYESEILYDLMKRDGLLNPSQENLPYESELKEKYVDEVKGAYPKVTDYRPEWLNYNLGYYIPADFPTESLENVTSGTVNNVVPYAFKSAILSGNTLVNMFGNSRKTMTPTALYWNVGSSILNVKPNTKYFVKIKSNYRLDFKYQTPNQTIKEITDTNSQTFTFTSSSDTGIVLITREVDVKYVVDVIMLEYQDGMENWDIPYFEGMQSVKMPVLTAIGKNILPSLNYISPEDALNLTKGNVQVKNGAIYSLTMNSLVSSTGLYRLGIMAFKNGENVTNSNTVTFTKGSLVFRDDTYKRYQTAGDTSELSDLIFTVNDDVELYIALVKGTNTDVNSNAIAQLEIGTVATSYEPYKSNILTVNDDVTLRRINKVKDELNLMTGKLTQRIGEIVFDGTEKFGTEEFADTGMVYAKLLSHQETVLGIGNIICNNFTGYQTSIFGKPFEGVYFVDGIKFMIKKDKLSEVSSSGVSKFLSDTGTIVQYEKPTPVAKTVDLNNVNQDGIETTFRPFEGTMHIQTDGTPLKPLFSGEIPVEATTQNLASFVNLEGVERTVNEYVDEEIVGDENNEQLL